MFRRDIVVVGASAGGVEALQGLVKGLPADFQAAVFVVLHVPAYPPSVLHEILGRHCKLKVSTAVDGEPFNAGRVYVAPADWHLMFEKERVRLTKGPKENRFRPAVDVLFRSAAFNFGPRVIGVLLSGMLDDGTAGLWAIKDRGGIAIVQSPAEANFASMPESALRHVEVDVETTVKEMPRVLNEFTRAGAKPARIKEADELLAAENRIAMEGEALRSGLLKLGRISPLTCPECHGVLVRIQQGTIVRYRCHTGHSFSVQTLLADVSQEIDKILWSAVRAIEARVILLRETHEALKEMKQGRAGHVIKQAQEAEKQVKKIREMLIESKTTEEMATEVED